MTRQLPDETKKSLGLASCQNSQMSEPINFTKWGRALILGLLAIGGGYVAHLSSGGLLPNWPWFFVFWGIGSCAAAFWLAKPASALLIVCLLTAEQLLVHLAISAMAGHLAAAEHHHDETLMKLLHFAVAIFMGWWLAVGEKYFWNLVNLVTDFLLRNLPHLRVLTPRSPATQATDFSEVNQLPRWLLTRQLPARAPPS